MQKHLVIPSYATDLLHNIAARGIGTGTHASDEAFKNIQNTIKTIQSTYPEAPPELAPNVTKADLMPNNSHMDTSLPQNWLDDYRKTMAPETVCICWDCNNNCPVGLTSVDKALVRAYENIVRRRL